MSEINEFMPHVILIGGSSGIGKSRIAEALSRKHGITHVIETDYLREVLRAIISEEHSPVLHRNSYNSFEVIENYGVSTEEIPLEELVRLGYLWHISPIISLIKRIIGRAYKDRDDIVIEGVHLCPGALDLSEFRGKMDVKFFILNIDEKAHYERFLIRARHKERDTERHLKYFKYIRIIQEFLIERAEKYGIPVIPNYNVDEVVIKVEEAFQD